MELARIEAQNGRCLEHQRACSLVGAEPRRRDRRPLAAVERTRHASGTVARLIVSVITSPWRQFVSRFAYTLVLSAVRWYLNCNLLVRSPLAGPSTCRYSTANTLNSY